MLAIAGDSAAGKTTLTRGLVAALGEDGCTSMCVDDYHRYDRAERREVPFTPLHPDCNYINIMEQHLQLLATGESILKPVYDHRTGSLTRPELVEPRSNVIVEGLLPLHSRLARACFDIAVYLAPPEQVRRQWKVARDTSKRGYDEKQVLAELDRREPEAEEFIRPQQRDADIVVSFGPIEGREDPPGTPLSATLLLRPTIRHPNFSAILAEVPTRAVHVKLIRDDDGSPVDALHIHGYAPAEESGVVAKAIWDSLDAPEPIPQSLGALDDGARNEPLRLVQLILLYHMLRTPA
ncbi:MAG: phosphoribulokinase [Pseudonocardiaceae bacterium]